MWHCVKSLRNQGKSIKKGNLCKSFAMLIINQYYFDGGGHGDVMTMVVVCQLMPSWSMPSWASPSSSSITWWCVDRGSGGWWKWKIWGWHWKQNHCNYHKSNFSYGTARSTTDAPEVEPTSRAWEKQCILPNLYPTYLNHDEHAKSRNKHRTDQDIPLEFDFPTEDLYVAWAAWLLRYPLNRSRRNNREIYLASVKTHHLLCDRNLPA